MRSLAALSQGPYRSVELFCQLRFRDGKIKCLAKDPRILRCLVPELASAAVTRHDIDNGRPLAMRAAAHSNVANSRVKIIRR